MRYILLLATLFAVPVSAAPVGGSFTLSIFEGFQFGTRQVVKSGTDTADLSFTYQTRRIGFISYLGADKISFFESAPSAVPSSEVNSWKDYVAGPEPGYYVLRARSDRKLYLVRLVEFANQGKAASYWKMRFEWQEFGGNRSGSAPPLEGRFAARYRREPAAAAGWDSSAAPGNARVQQAVSGGETDHTLSRTGHDIAYEARRRVLLKIQIVTPLTAGRGGELKWAALCEPGTRDKVGTDMILPALKVGLSVPPGRYDLWIEGSNDRAELVRTVDLSAYGIGDVISTTISFAGWGAEQRAFGASPASEPSLAHGAGRTADSAEEFHDADGSPDDDAAARIRRAQERAAQRGRVTGDDTDERIRRAQDAASQSRSQ